MNETRYTVSALGSLTFVLSKQNSRMVKSISVFFEDWKSIGSILVLNKGKKTSLFMIKTSVYCLKNRILKLSQ